MDLLDFSRKSRKNVLWAAGGSLAVNLFLWGALSSGSNQPVIQAPPPELVFDRVVMEKHEKKSVPVFHPIAPPKPPPPQPAKEQPVKHERMDKPAPPEGSHNRILTQVAPNHPSADHSTVLPGGSARLGAPTSGQNPGQAPVNPPAAVTQPTPPPPAPVPPAKHEDAPPPTPPPAPPAPPAKHEETPAPPPPPPPPKPKGETREAKPDHQENVEIPESLKSASFKSFVRVRVTIGADGKFTVFLRTSSGNADIDKLVTDTLNRWTWKPALKDGVPVDSVQQFRFNFSIE